MAAVVIQVYAGEIKNINGVSVEEADYNMTRLLDENSSEGIADRNRTKGKYY